MTRRYVALLRAISNVPMQPFREAMHALGFDDVESYGMSGNLLFTVRETDAASLERRIAARLGTPAMVRTRSQMASILAHDPFGSAILFLARAPTPAKRRELQRGPFAEPRPSLVGSAVYFVHPPRMEGRSAPVDLERLLDVVGTARSARVVAALLERMR